jgi:hypothetical protein
MKQILSGAVGLLILGAATSPAIDFASFDDAPGVVITGIRSTSAVTDDVVITASYTSGGLTTGALYSGSLAAAPGAPASSWVSLAPTFDGQTVTSTSLYGPNTARFTPSIGAGNVTAVGSYKYDEGASGPGFDHGLIYKGSVLGGGTFQQIDANPLVTSGSLLNTIAHSNMGNLVVGNYDTDIETGKAFIYDMDADTWVNLNPAGSASVTAYGIWENSATSFTIAGGFSDVTSFGLDAGYLVNYDPTTGILSDYKTYNFDNAPITSLVSHFDGISATVDGFTLTGDYIRVGGGVGAFFASVTVLPDGSFSEAKWTDIAFPEADFTSGNTVVDNNVLGIHSGTEGVFSYLAAVPEPTSGTLLALGVGLLFRRNRRCDSGVNSPHPTVYSFAQNH